MERANPECVHCGKAGYGCIALVDVDEGCFDGLCPFYTTDFALRVSEARARKRLEILNIPFVSREEVIQRMEYNAKYDKRTRKNIKPKKTGVIQYNSRENSYIEYNSIESACAALGIKREKLELIVKKNEPYNGYRFVYI